MLFTRPSFTTVMADKVEEYMEGVYKLVMKNDVILGSSNVNKMQRVLHFIKSGKVGAMKALARVWAPCQMQGDWIDDTLEALKCLEYIENTRATTDTIGPDGRIESTLEVIYERHSYLPLGQIVSGISGEKWKVRRHVHSILAILALMCEDPHRIANYVECLRLFNQTIPDDFATLPEMRDALVHICNDLEFRSPCDPVSGFMARLQELYPESRGYRVPRKLLHLCRVRINSEILNSGRTLLEGVPNLSIPAVMKDYLLFDCDN